MAEHAGEKSFEATPHRRQEAREKGQVAFSHDLGSAALLLLCFCS
jgi:flagellar biosynthesis protein FlhB